MATLFIIAGQHGDEPEGLVLAQALYRAARAVLNGAKHVKFYGMINPEGFARTRRPRDDNQDPNRVWGTAQESALQAQIRKEILECASRGPVAVIDCHNDHKAPHVLFAGPVTQSFADLMPIGSRLDLDDGSLTAWCEAQGISALTAEAQAGSTTHEIVEALTSGLRKWIEV